MFITQCYKYKYNGIVYVGGQVHDGAEILETMNILNAEKGFNLIRIVNEENIGNSVWLHDGDIQENYKEIKDESPEEPEEESAE